MNKKELYLALSDLNEKIVGTASGEYHTPDTNSLYQLQKSFILPMEKECAGDLFGRLNRLLKFTALLHLEGDEDKKRLFFAHQKIWCGQFEAYIKAHSTQTYASGLMIMLGAMQSTLEQMAEVCCGRQWSKGQGTALLCLGVMWSVYDNLVAMALHAA